MEQTDLCGLIDHSNDVDRVWHNWLSDVMSAVKRNIPEIEIKDRSAPPWIDAEARHLHNVKHTAWSRAKRSNKPGDWSKFKQIRNKLKNTLRTKHKTFMAGISEAVSKNPKRFWTYFKFKTKQKSIPNTIELNSILSSDNKEKCELFNTHFHASFNPSDVDAVDQLPPIQIQVNQR